MSPRRIAVGRARAVKAILALTAASACLGAVAYAATRPAGLGGSKPVNGAPGQGAGAPQGREEERLLRPRFIEYPEAVSSLAEPRFRFHVPPRSQRPGPPLPGGPSGEPTPPRRFQCKLDDGGWSACSSPYRLSGLASGGHAFAVRAFNRAERAGPALSYSWRYLEPPRQDVEPSGQEQVDPKPFSVELRGELEDLYPGYPEQQVPVLITNPNPVPIEVTNLTVGIAGDPPSCSAENFALIPSNLSPTAPLTVPAGASAGLPTATISAPSISMLNLSVNQDACRGAEVPLVFSGEAHG